LQSRKTFVNFIRERNELGASSSADVVRAESRVAGALELLSNSLQKLKQAQAIYRQYFNEEAEAYILPKELSVESLNEFDLENYLLNHPDILSNQLLLSSAKAQLEAVEAENKGSLSVQGDFSYSMSPGSYTFNDDISGGLVFSRDLYTGGTEKLKKERSELAVYQKELALDKSKISIAKNIRESFAGYEGAVSAVDAQMLVLNGSKESYSITKELYAFSRVSLFEVLSSQEELFNSGTKLIDSIINRALAKYQLLHATQKLFEQIDNEIY
jgi:outer membrane protein TolC